MFVIVLNFKNQTSIWAHKHSFKVKQRRGFRLNMYFLWNLSRPVISTTKSTAADFLIFCSKALTTKNDHLTRPPTRFQVNPLGTALPPQRRPTELDPKSFACGNCWAKVFFHLRGSCMGPKNSHWVPQIQCRKSTVPVHFEKRTVWLKILKILEHP